MVRLTTQVRRGDYDYAMIAVKEGKREPHGMGAAPASIAAATVGDTESAIAWLQSNFTSDLINRRSTICCCSRAAAVSA